MSPSLTLSPPSLTLSLTALMAEGTQSKWEGKSTAELKSARPDQIWPFLEDFCSLHNWMPNIDTCYRVDGVQGQPGLIRYCASVVPAPSPDNPDQTTIKWVNEKLLTIDPINHCFTYEVLDNNIDFNSYVATIKLLPIDGGSSSSGGAGCRIEWSFVCDPIQGWRLEDLASYIDSSLQFMAKKMENTVQQIG